jgi:hypothetical protein
MSGAINSFETRLKAQFTDAISVVRLSGVSATFHIAVRSEPFRLERLWKLCDELRREFDICYYIHLTRENGHGPVAVEVIVDEEYRHVPVEPVSIEEECQSALTEAFQEITYRGSYRLSENTVYVCELELDRRGAFNVGHAMDRLFRSGVGISIRLYPVANDRPFRQTCYAVVNRREKRETSDVCEKTTPSTTPTIRRHFAKGFSIAALVYVLSCLLTYALSIFG